MAKYQPPIIVVGTGRSGTSMMAGILYHLGVHMGDEFIQADRNNPAGPFEDVDFANINTRFLGEEDKKKILPKFAKKVQNMVRVKGIQERVWGWKIPNTTNLLDVYTGIAPKAKFVICQRPFEESVESCMRAYDWSKEKAVEFLSPRVKQIDKYFGEDGDFSYTRVDFKDIINKTGDVVDNLIDFLDLNPTKEQKEAAIDHIYDKSETKEAKILFVIPSKDLQLHASVHEAIRESEKDGRYKVDFKILQGSPVSHVRNKIAQKAVEDEYDFLIMLDDDVVPTKNPLDLIELNKDIVGLPTPIFHKDMMMHNAVIDVGGTYKPLPGRLQKGLLEVDAVGTGCIIINTEVLKSLQKPFEFGFDDKGLKTKGEDFLFCHKAKEKGFKVWTHFDYECEHWNTINMLKILRAFKQFEGK